jgi:hypothetical protein
MTWVRLEDNMIDHPKIIGLSDRAFRLWITSLSYASRHETDGKLDRKIAERLLARGLGARKELLEAGLWDENGTGYYIHDYLEYQPSKAESCDLRAKRAAAGRLGGLRSKRQANAQVHAQAKNNPDPSNQDVSIDQEDSTEDDHALRALLVAMDETERSQAHLELLAFRARGSSEYDFRQVAGAVSRRRDLKSKRAYVAKALENRLRERSTA